MFALGVGIPVIPLLFESTDIPPRLKALDVLDFGNLRRLPWERLIEKVETIRSKGLNATPSHTQAIGSQSAVLVGTGQARTLLDLVNLIRTGSEDRQQAALMALAEIDPDALLRLVRNALRLDELRIPFIQGLIDRTLPPARHVFLSYSRHDTPLMSRLRDDMRKAELAVWTDEALTPGDPSWQLAIEQAIEQAGCVVVILSPDSKKSEWVLAELQYARMHKRVIVPVLMRGSETEAIPMAFINWQWLDLRDETSYGAGLERLVGALGQYLRRMSPAAV